jgi:hypothetical protein
MTRCDAPCQTIILKLKIEGKAPKFSIIFAKFKSEDQERQSYVD